MKNYKYQVLQGVKVSRNSEYNQYDLMGEFTNLKDANKCFNKYKKEGEYAYTPRRFYQETILQKSYDGDEYEDKTEYLKVEEWEFDGYKCHRM